MPRFSSQACQGGGIDRGVRAEEADDDEPKSLPTEADVFIFFATPFGKISKVIYLTRTQKGTI